MQIAEATAQRLVQEAVIAQAQERVHLILEAALFKKSNRRKNDWIELLSAWHVSHRDVLPQEPQR